MRVCEVVQLQVEQIIHVKSHLSEQPVVCLIHRVYVRRSLPMLVVMARRRKSPERVDKDVGSASGCPASRSPGVWGLVRMIIKEEAPLVAESLKGSSSRHVLHHSLIDHKGETALAQVKMPDHVGIEGEPFHREQQVMCPLCQHAGGNSIRHGGGPLVW